MLSSLGQTVREDSIFIALFFLAFFAFALLGLDLFSGSGWTCTDTLKIGPNLCFGVTRSKSVYGTSILLPVAWKGSSFSSHSRGFFDNIWMSMQTLLNVLSIEGWLTVFYSTADLNIDTSQTTAFASQSFTNANDDPVLQPVQNMNSTTFIFFLFYIVVFSFFLLQTFVATILSNIAQKSPTGRLTTEQLQWFLLKQQLKLELPIVTARPMTTGAISVASMINRREFDILALAAAVVNAAFIAITGNSASDDQRNIAWYAESQPCKHLLCSSLSSFRYINIVGCFIELIIFAARRCMPAATLTNAQHCDKHLAPSAFGQQHVEVQSLFDTLSVFGHQSRRRS